MRKSGIAAAAAAAALVLVPACGNSDSGSEDDTSKSSSDNSNNSEDSGDEGEDNGEAAGSDEGSDKKIPDLKTAMLGAEDLPAGAKITPIDVNKFAKMGADSLKMMKDLKIEPAECGTGVNEVFSKSKVNGQMQSAVAGTTVVVTGVLEGSDQVDQVEEQAKKCGDISMSGTVQGTQLNVKTTTKQIQAPKLDAEKTVAFQQSTASPNVPAQPMKLIYVVEGDYTVTVTSTDPAQADTLAQKALEKLKAAQK